MNKNLGDIAILYVFVTYAWGALLLAAAGGVQPSLKEGGASPEPEPQLVFGEVPMVKLSVAPLATSG